jgi:hypothetical protein
MLMRYIKWLFELVFFKLLYLVVPTAVSLEWYKKDKSS